MPLGKHDANSGVLKWRLKVCDGGAYCLAMSDEFSIRITSTIERASERGDPSPLIYERLFRKHPELEALFVRDKNHAVRANMTVEAVNAIFDYLGPNTYGENLFRIELVNHENLGVPQVAFPDFFDAMRDALREMLADDWTARDETAWDELLRRLRGIIDTSTC